MFRFIKKLVSKPKPKEDVKKIPARIKEKLEQTSSDTHWGIGLPAALMSNTLFGYHARDEAEKFAQVSDQAKEAYKSSLLATDFVAYVVKGEQDQAEKMLLDNPTLKFDLLSKKVSVKDNSGRTFFNVTALQYAAWALDRHMWTMLKKHMTNEDMKKQLNDMEQQGGVEYQTPAATDKKPEIRREMQYDFNELIDALQNYMSASYGYLARYNPMMLMTHSYRDVIAACQSVGHAQYKVPVHVANEYCRRDRSFASVPNFKEDKNLPRTCWIPLLRVDWFSNDELNVDGAIFRGNLKWGVQLAASTVWVDAGIVKAAMDLAAMKALYETRSIELIELKDSVLQPTSTANQRQFYR